MKDEDDSNDSWLARAGALAGGAFGLYAGARAGMSINDWMADGRSPVDDDVARWLTDDPRHGPAHLNEDAPFLTGIVALAGVGAWSGAKLGRSNPHKALLLPMVALATHQSLEFAVQDGNSLAQGRLTEDFDDLNQGASAQDGS